eukprot:2479573-Karenia_brevis.AAC.1
MNNRTAHHTDPAPVPCSSPAFRASARNDVAPAPGPSSSPAFRALAVVGSQPNMRFPFLTDIECLCMRQSSWKQYRLFRD